MIWLGLSKYLKPVQVVLGFFLIFLSNIIAGPLTDLTRYIVHWIPDLEKSAIRMEAAYETAVQSMTYIKGFPDFLMSLLVMAVLPAVFEELFFRGALQNLLAKWWRKPMLAVIVVSLIFSLTHASIYLFPARFILGFALGWMYFLTRNLWVNIIAHFLNNAIVVVQLYYYSSQNKKIPLDKMDPQVDWWIALFALVCLIYLFRKMKEKSEVTIMKIHAKEQLLEAQYKKDIWAGG
jgi:membrane protease YdiL (CAAX protease family)